MLRHALFLLFLYGIKNCSSSSDIQEQAIEPKDVRQNGIKKNEVGANGLEANWGKMFTNFRNPVLEYLLHTNSDRTNDPSKKGVVREIRHSQVLFMPNFPRSSLPPFFINQWPQFESLKKPSEEGARNPESSPVGTFWNFLKNKTPTGDETYKEGVVTSPVLHLNKDADEAKEETRIQTYPAVAVVINTFSKDGSLKKSITHFQPDFNSIRPERIFGGAIHPAQGSNANKISEINSSHNTVKNFVKDGDSGLSGKNTPHGWPWPFSNYFPIVINDPFLTMYNAFATSMYNAVSSMVEYGPEADVCRKDQERDSGSDKLNIPGLPERKKQTTSAVPGRYINGGLEEDIFGEVKMRSESLKRIHDKALANEKPEEGDRKKRDTTSIFVKSREGDTVDISLKEPPDVNTRKISEGSDLILRKGGIAIAGPGGAATAYTGGTAIVGPYGTVYKSPEGTAILGPFSKVINITDDTTFEEILKMHKQLQSQNQQPAPENQLQGKGFKNYRNFFSYFTNLPVKFEMKPQGRSFIKSRPKIMRLKEEGIMKAIAEIRDTEFRRIVQDTPYEQRGAKANETTLVFRPKSKAEAGRNGVALSAPTSHAILYPEQRAHIYFEPESVASAGPSGFAHAHSDLLVTYVRNDTRFIQAERRRRSPGTVFLGGLIQND